jgi:hypothetical protein
LLGEYGRNIQELSLHDVTIPNSRDSRGKRLTSVNVNTEGLLFFKVGFLDLQESVLSVKTGVLSESARNHKEGISEGDDSELYLTRNSSSGMVMEVLCASDFERTGTGKDALVHNGVGHSSKTVTDSISGLGDGVIVGSLDEDSAGEGVLNTFNESVLIFTEGLLVDDLSETHIGLTHIINGAEHLTTASEGDALTVSLLSAADTDDTSAGKNFEGRGVNALLVDNDEVLVSALAELFLEVDDLTDFVVSECALGSDKLLSLVSVGPEETGVDFGLFVFEGDIEAHDVTVLKSGGEVRVSATVIEHETTDELGLSGHLVLHVHKFDHVQVNWLAFLGDAVDCVDDDFAKRVGQLRGDLGVKGSAGNFDEEVTGDFSLNFEGFEELKGLSLGELHTVNEDTGVDGLTKVALSLAHEFTDEEDIGGGTITDDIVLSGGSATDHGSSGVLDLHLVEEDSSIFGQLDLAGTANEPKNRFN